jgi:hypothetical protein
MRHPFAWRDVLRAGTGVFHIRYVAVWDATGWLVEKSKKKTHPSAAALDLFLHDDLRFRGLCFNNNVRRSAPYHSVTL